MRGLDLDTHQKALRVNLDARVYGTFAEIGAGQEIARCFFRVGGAAGTVAKTMSAYDMLFSDAIYGKSSRYVSKDRLNAMLEHEFTLLQERLGESRGDQTTFFAFADTVSARNFEGTNECHGWMGIRLQTRPHGPANDIILHVNMLDRENVLQQEALGILGVNLLFGAFYEREEIDSFLANLIDDLAVERLEIDVLEFHGPDFAQINNELVAIKLIRSGLGDAIVFDPVGTLRQPSAVIRKHPVLIERGSFRALQNLRTEMINASHAAFAQDVAATGHSPMALMEISVNPYLEKEAPSDHEILSTVKTLTSLGHNVMVSKFVEFFNVTSYLRRYTQEPLGFVMGVSTLVRIFHGRYYQELEGKILEGLGKLLSFGVKLYVYPLRKEDFASHLVESGLDPEEWVPSDLAIISAEQLVLPSPLKHLYTYLLESGQIIPVDPSIA